MIRESRDALVARGFPCCLDIESIAMRISLSLCMSGPETELHAVKLVEFINSGCVNLISADDEEGEGGSLHCQ